MSIFMHKYIDQIVGVKCESNYNYHIVSTFHNNGEENHTLVCQHLIRELKVHKKSYTMLYEKNNISKKFMHLLLPVLAVQHQWKMDVFP